MNRLHAHRLIGLLDLHTVLRAQQDLSQVLDRTLKAGVSQIVFRTKGCSREQIKRVSWQDLVQAVQDRGGRAIIHSSLAHTDVEVHSSWMHRTAWDARTMEAQPHRWQDTEIRQGVSVHDLDELALAKEQRAEWIFASPFAPTASKPGYGPSLGCSGIHVFAAVSQLPVFALGGVNSKTIAGLGDTGAAGCVVMGMLVQPDAHDQLRSLLDALEKERWKHPTPW